MWPEGVVGKQKKGQRKDRFSSERSSTSPAQLSDALPTTQVPDTFQEYWMASLPAFKKTDREQYCVEKAQSTVVSSKRVPSGCQMLNYSSSNGNTASVQQMRCV